MLNGRILALLMTVLVVAVVGYFAWSGFKAPPVATPAAIVTTPPGWQRLDGGLFTLFAPEGARLRRAEKNGIVYGDMINAPYCVRFLAGKGVQPAVNPKTHADFTDEPIVVDGHDATMRKAVLQEHEQRYWFGGCNAPFYAGLIVPGAMPGGGNLVIDVTAASSEGLDDAKMMFKSVRLARTP